MRNLLAAKRIVVNATIAACLLLLCSSCMSSYSQQARVYLYNSTDSVAFVSFRVPQELDTVWWIGGKYSEPYAIGSFMAKGVALYLEGYLPSDSCRGTYPKGTGPSLPRMVFLRHTIDTVFRSNRRLLDTANFTSTRPDSLWSRHAASRRFISLFHHAWYTRHRAAEPVVDCNIVDWQPDSTGLIRITINLQPHDRLVIAEHYDERHVSDPVEHYANYFAPEGLSVSWRTFSRTKRKSFKTKKLLNDLLARVHYSPSLENSFEVADSVVCN